MSTVQVVFCMDTEGPCDDPDNSELLKDWTAVDSAMSKLFNNDFRFQHPDSNGGGIKIGWFFLSWVGFLANPRNRDFGFHKVRDHYNDLWANQMLEFKDEHCWHYHHPSQSRVGNEWGLDWSICKEYEEIISRQILDRRWFPVCYRAGGTIMDAQSSRWVDSWFPFDFSNRAPLTLSGLVDWSGGVDDWALYHPDSEDFRQSGSGNRLMARCLDLVTGVYTLTDQEIHKAFHRAKAGQPAIISVFDHDYRDIADRITDFCCRVSEISKQYSGVTWRYANPTEAIRNYLGTVPERCLKLYSVKVKNTVRIWSTAPLFQHIPWIAIELQNGDVVHCSSGVVRVSATEWIWQIPESLKWMRIGFAGSTADGNSEVSMLGNGESPMQDFFNQPLEEHPSFPNNIEYHSKLLPELCIRRASGEAEAMDSVRQASDLLKPYLDINCTVLDIGCAAGQAGLTLRELGVDYFGIDDYQLAVQIGKAYLSSLSLPAQNLRNINIEQLPKAERYSFVICLHKFRYFSSYQLPLEIMARATEKILLIRGTFGIERIERYLPDVLLEPGFQAMHASFNIYSKTEIEKFLKREGFKITWIPDVRQRERFSGGAEVVGGIPFYYEFLLAQRIAPPPTSAERLGAYWSEHARLWSSEKSGLPLYSTKADQ